jgi:glycosyltransferase involved in cell wall biosynthesis
LVNPVLSLFPGPILAVSNDLRRHLVQSGFPGGRVGVLYNGIQPGKPTDAHARALARQSLGLGDAEFVVGTVARLNPVKDLGLLVDAFGELFGLCPKAHLVIIGDGPERPELERRARELGYADYVLFAGHRDDARQLLPALDVYVNSSITEGMSVTILEAMAAGLPVVATRAGGNPELVDDGVTGLLVQVRSAADLAHGLRRLLASPADRAAMGAGGRAKLVAEFSLDRMVQQYFRAYGMTGSL